MPTKTTLLLLSIVTFFLLTGCTKDDTISNDESLLGTWSISGISSNTAYDWDGDGRTETDILGTYTSCQRDIVLVFDRNGSGETRQGCNAPWENLNWQRLGSSRLDIYIPSGDINLDIIQFDGSTLRGRDQVNVDGRNVDITYTLYKR